MASFVFNTAKRKLFEDTLNLGADALEVRLVTAAPDPDASVAGDLAAVEFADASYAAQPLASKEVVYDAGTQSASVTGADVLFERLEGDGTAVVGIVVSRVDADAAGRHVVCFNQFTEPYTPNGADLTVEIALAGVLKAQ